MEARASGGKDERRFLHRFSSESAERNVVAQWFHAAAREGAPTPRAVVEVVADRAHRQVARQSNHPSIARKLIGELTRAQDEALDYARFVLEWNRLPTSERKGRKREKAEQYRQEYQRRQPVTERQRAFLLARGVPVPGNRLEASEDIRHCKGQFTPAEIAQLEAMLAEAVKRGQAGS
jgi:hypothetical protein